MSKQIKYREGPKAMESFKSMAIALFKAPKTGGRKTKKSSKSPIQRKRKSSDKD